MYMRNISTDKKQDQFSHSISKVKSQKVISLSELDTETCSQTPRTKAVKFSESLTRIKLSRVKHANSPILKESKFGSGKGKTYDRSGSVSSLCGPKPLKDDQSCDNTQLNKKIINQYEVILRKYSNRQNYQDQLFPPGEGSIATKLTKSQEQYKQIIWMRISDVYKGKEVVVLGAEPAKCLISGSRLVSSYFTLGLNCLKYSKSILLQIFGNQKPNPQGAYCLKIFHGNFWKSIIIDDYIPVVEQQSKKGDKTFRPAFTSVEKSTKSIDPIQIWPLLLQKAFAKFYSGYSSLQKGNIFDFLEQLTNCPYEFIDLSKDSDDLYQVLEQKRVIGFGETFNNQRIPIQFIVGQSGKLMFIMKDKRMLVDPTQLGQYFEGIYTFSCKDYKYVGYCPIKKNKENISLRKISLSAKSRCSFTLYQKDQRYYQFLATHQYSWVRLILLQKQFGQFSYRWIDGRYENFKSITIEETLEAGQYYLVVIPEFENNRQTELNLVIRCSALTILERQKYKPEILQAGCTDLAQRFGVLNQVNADICSYNCIHEDMGMIIENFNNEKEYGYIRITKKIGERNQESKLNLQAINEDFKGINKAEILIKGGEHYTIVMLTKGGTSREVLENFDFTA